MRKLISSPAILQGTASTSPITASSNRVESTSRSRKAARRGFQTRRIPNLRPSRAAKPAPSRARLNKTDDLSTRGTAGDLGPRSRKHQRLQAHLLPVSWRRRLPGSIDRPLAQQGLQAVGQLIPPCVVPIVLELVADVRVGLRPRAQVAGRRARGLLDRVGNPTTPGAISSPASRRISRFVHLTARRTAPPDLRVEHVVISLIAAGSRRTSSQARPRTARRGRAARDHTAWPTQRSPSARRRREPALISDSQLRLPLDSRTSRAATALEVSSIAYLPRPCDGLRSMPDSNGFFTPSG